MTNTDSAILVINCGSSSIKFALFSLKEKLCQEACVTGYVDLAPQKTKAIARITEGPAQFDLVLADAPCAYETVLERLAIRLQSELKAKHVRAVAHRIVHGGERFASSIVLNAEALAYVSSLCELAPLHQRHQLAGVVAFTRAFLHSQQIACFDTGFHVDLPLFETLVPLPFKIRKLGVRRFGFHGLSYRFVADCLSRHSPSHQSPTPQRVVVAHLGSGASVCGMLGGKSHTISMGFSALDGLMMGTRCGSLDPGILLYLLKKGYQCEQLETMLYSESGLLGMSGISSDMRILRVSPLPAAALAIDLFTHKLLKEIGASIASLGGIDALVFTGGIGENDALLRASICNSLSYLGISIDIVSNDTRATHREISALHSDDSKVEVWVVNTNEALVAAQDACRLIKG